MDGETGGREERLGGRGDKPFVGDGEGGTKCLFSCILEFVNVLRDAGIFLPPGLHFDEE
jgi:hypothetical protein